jgi:hypothetical protein
MVPSADTPRINPTTANLARIDEWLDALATEVDTAAQSEALTSYLQTLARFWTYSARNCWLVSLQMPTATRVASRKTWESMGRCIKRDQWKHALHILCPHFRKEWDPETGEEREVLSHFSTGYVYDISMTEGRPIAAAIWQQVAGDYSQIYASLLDCVRRAGLVVEERDLPEGMEGYSTGRGVIVLNVRESLGNRCQTLLHEVAHERCHGVRERTTFSTAMLECQAECIAYCCCLALSIPSPNSPTYLAIYRIDRATLVANLEVIRAGVARIMRELEQLCKQETAVA